MKRVVVLLAGTGLIGALGSQVVERPGQEGRSSASLGLATPHLIAEHASAPLRPASSSTNPLLERIALASVHAPSAPALSLSNEQFNEVIQRTCSNCHSDTRRTGNLSLAGYDIARATESPHVTEGMITKLRLDMMPPPGSRRPGADTLRVLAETLERIMDDAYARDPNPGFRPFQRLNRAEYARSIRELIGLEVDPGNWLPLDVVSANFDNIADVQLPSSMLLNSYLEAAAAISRLALGDPQADPTSIAYQIPRLASQWEHVDGAPLGTRGGLVVEHNFPADGDYVFNIQLQPSPDGQLYGRAAPFDEQIEISVDGQRVALLEVDRWMTQGDPSGLNLRTDPIPIEAGARRVAAAFIATFDGPVNDLVAPYGHSIVDTQIGIEHAITNVTHMRELVIAGPRNVRGVSDTPTRQRILTCRPATESQARPCAERILRDLAARAYRRPLTDDDLTPLMAFYDEGAAEGGFEVGMRAGLEAVLASPHFIFRMERIPDGVTPGTRYRLSDLDLASRLSFFLWGTPPDQELIDLARRGRLSDDRVLERQARRMLADPRSEALATRFAAQWLRLQDLGRIIPDPLMFPDFHEQLARDMRRETELFFHALVREDRSLLELYDADFSYMNERLARHYGIPGVRGEHFRKVQYPEYRRGILAHGSVLTLTSMANRTSPVLRGKWVMEVLLGSEPPPPPPGVPDLEETEGAREGRLLTTRERMEMHRASPACRSCHMFMDPIGLALDSYDVVGRWRIRENGMPLDTRGDYYDGTPVSTPGELNRALLNRPIPLVRTFTENLMAYALARRIEPHDKPAVRAVAAHAEANGHRMSEFIVGVVRSDAFRMRMAGQTLAETAAHEE